jgi:hypothetical protein
MKCEDKNCTIIATTKNLQYHPDKWLCTYHANKAVKKGRIKRKINKTKT